jgi:Protein of unknown function (DUF2637)
MLSRRGFRLAALTAACVCLLAIAAGAFALSYLGVRDTALAAGVNPPLARFYPLVFDAVLVVACAAAVTLRGALRVFAWLAVLVVVGAVATADTVHVMSITVPQRQLEATIAIAPWVALLTGLTLLDAMFRRAAPRRRAEAAAPVPANGRAPAAGSPDWPAAQPGGAAVVPLSTMLHDSPATPAARPRTTASQPAAGVGQPRTTASQPAAGVGQPDAPASPAKTTTSPHAVDPGQRAVAGSPPVVAQAVPAPQAPEQDAPGDADAGSEAPVAYLDRMRSTPTPPEG